MARLAVLALVACLLAIPAGAASLPRVLFVGNSFTFAAGSPVQHHRAHTVTDLNGHGTGGVPALFKSFAEQAGLSVGVFVEAISGAGLDRHLALKRDLIGGQVWDVVVMQGYSTLDEARPGDPGRLIEAGREFAKLVRASNPRVRLVLMATWSRADQTYPPTGAWAGQDIGAMARDVRRGYDGAAAAAGIDTVIPVGEAWLRAMRTGVADANPYDGIDPGRVDLWAADHYHASSHGSYLTALVVFGSLTGRDPRSLGDFECSGRELGLSRQQVVALQQVAFDELVVAGAITAAPASGRSDKLSALPDRQGPPIQPCSPP